MPNPQITITLRICQDGAPAIDTEYTSIDPTTDTESIKLFLDSVAIPRVKAELDAMKAQSPRSSE
jgi:hypothetical protein